MNDLHNFALRTVARQFSAAEVEEITGVTGATQRDWRRRGFLGEKREGRAHYSLDDLIEIMTLRFLTQAGLPISHAADLAGLAVLPIYANFARWGDVSVFTGDPINEAQMARVRGGTVKGVSDDDNWLFAALDDENPRMGRTDDLRKLEGSLFRATCAIILDLNSLAHKIAQRAPLPLITYHITAAD